MRPKVSIIVPIYNVEPFIDECVKSILAQTLEDIEIILVDDGSTDASGKIADSYALNDQRIKVIHRDNGGLGPARNSGIEAATGLYLGFVDSDDWIDPSMYAVLFSKADESGYDAVYSGMKVVANGRLLDDYSHPYAGQVLKDHDSILDFRSAFYGTMPTKEKIDLVPVSVCNGLFKREIIERFGISFKNIRSEDKFFNIEFCGKAKSIAFAEGAFYNYRKDDQPSITKSFRDDTINSYIGFLTDLYELALAEDEERRDSCILRVQRCIIDSCRVLLGTIVKSSSRGKKRSLVADLVSQPLVRKAVLSYPWSRLPFGQAVFFLALKNQMVRTLIFLAAIRSLLPLNGNRGK